jgi:hypothetical protein
VKGIARKHKGVRLRWKHRCPGCKRIIFWEKVYCLPCIRLEPSRGHFLLSRNQKWLKLARLSGIKQTSNHIFTVVGDKTVCVDCGRRMSGATLKHRCYSRSDASVYSKKELSCSVCKKRKLKLLFPLIKAKRLLIRIRVCADCLDGSRLVIAKKKLRNK